MFDGDGFDDYGAAPGLDANWLSNGGGGGASLVTGRFGVGQRLRITSSGGSRFYSRGLGSNAKTITVGMMVDPILFAGSSTCFHFALSMGSTYQVGWQPDANGAILFRRQSAVNGGTLIYQTANGVLAQGREDYLEVTWVIDNTVGSIFAMMNGTDVVANIGGLDTQNHATLDTVDTIRVGISLTAQGSTEYDDIYWRDDATMLGDVRWVDQQPDGDGMTLDFVPSTGTAHAALVDEAIVSVADYLSGSNIGDLDELTLASLASVPAQIHLVKAVDWALKTDAAARSIDVGIDSSGTIDDGVSKALTTTLAQYTSLFPIDPATGVAWAPSALASLARRLKVAA